MITVENLWRYWRSCLVKLGEANVETNCKSFSVKKFPDIRHLMDVCLSKPTVEEDSSYNYAPFICRLCFDKWTAFAKLYQFAMRADEKIRKILKKELSKTAAVGGKNIIVLPDEKKNETNTQSFADEHIIEKYETNFPFFVNNPLTNINLYDKDILSPTIDPAQFDNQQISDTLNLASLSDEDSISSFSDKINEYDLSTGLKTRNAKTKNREKIKNLKNSSEVKKEKLQCDHNILSKKEKILSDSSKIGTKKIRFQCKECNKYFWERNRYDGHMKQVHNGIQRPYECHQCDKSYNLYKTLLQHKREYHSDKSREAFKCEQCDKIFKTAVILKQHLNNKHAERKESLRSICDQCGFIAAHQYSLTRHIINKHTETDQIKCNQCPKVFKTRYSLKYHVIGNHNLSNIKPFKCPECHMEFTRKTLLDQHKRTHLKYTERIKCDFEGCMVRFVKRGDKTHHMRLVHLKIKQHICDLCGEAFGAMQTLRHHRFIHTGEKPYKCNVCGQGFRQRTAMKTHRKSHFGKEERDVI